MKLINWMLVGCSLAMASCAPQKEQQQITFADPTIACFDGMYYMYGTEPKPQTGIPVLQSADLKTWEVPAGTLKDGHALEGGVSAYGTKGFWAPQVVEHNGKYYMIYTANENIAVAKSERPIGPFVQDSVAALKSDVNQIDPVLLFDTDGKMYLYHVRLHEGNSIWVAEFKEDMSGIKEETLTQCITATEPWEDTQTFESAPVIEGPTVVKRDGIYYLLYSANHFASKDYAVGYATSTSPYGPWKKPDGNPIISKENIHQNGTGHGDLFRDAKGDWKYVFHVHNSDTAIHPRRTLMVDVEFAPDQASGEEIIRIKPETVVVPVMKPAASN